MLIIIIVIIITKMMMMIIIIIIMIIIIIIIIIITIIIITKKFISFIREVLRAWPNIHDETKNISKYKFMSFFFQPHFVYLRLSLFK